MISIYIVRYADGTLAAYIDGRCALSEVLANYQDWLERHPEVKSNFRNVQYWALTEQAVALILENEPLYLDDYAVIDAVPLSDVYEEDLLAMMGPDNDAYLN